MMKHKLPDLDLLSFDMMKTNYPSKIFIKSDLEITLKGWKSFRVLEFFQHFFVSPQAELLKKARKKVKK